MKRVFRERDNFGGLLEVNVLDRNNKTPEDLIYVRMRRAKRKNKKRRGIEKEIGFCIVPWEALDLIRGLYLGIDEILEQYHLERFKIDEKNGK